MKTATLAGLALACMIAVPVIAGPVADRVRFALTPIDSQPTTQQLNLVHNNSEQEALDNLQEIALGDGVDTGVQLRAVRALVQYCKSPCGSHEAHDTLVTLIGTPKYRDSRAGRDLLVLRATIEAIGVLRVVDDMNLLLPFLQHPSRDIRAATAHALRDLGNTQAITPLRTRYLVEDVPQVQNALSDALRVLGQPIQ
ncbi:MAG: HEAT repeat domain-containing protein [Kofleriaceae bacterium]